MRRGLVTQYSRGEIDCNKAAPKPPHARKRKKWLPTKSSAAFESAATAPMYNRQQHVRNSPPSFEPVSHLGQIVREAMAAEDVRCHEIMRERDERELMTSMQGASGRRSKPKGVPRCGTWYVHSAQPSH